ncbi:hypothetical protein ACWEWI_28205 [Streptomyces sp. NPDC003753]|uniref:hypothetical protein n=1 Tax=unclassified Streptomyces TaxID=2593676 RepID=UPI001903F00C|nr:hypothetical protein [Streptomyces sp. Y2F8-2]
MAEPTEDFEGLEGAVVTVLATVDDALTQFAAGGSGGTSKRRRSTTYGIGFALALAGSRIAPAHTSGALRREPLTCGNVRLHRRDDRI